MGRPQGFMTISRKEVSYRTKASRIHDFLPVEIPLSQESTVLQAHRCMDCGVPFCHVYGCPLGNRIPDYADAISHEAWQEALDILHSTNNFPEFTGRICPALCEAACTLAVNFAPTTCRQFELQIVELGWKRGWIVPQIARSKSGKRVAVIGSGPAGLAAAQQLCRLGHDVVVFEKSDRLGGLLMYGIPNFKMEKEVIQRRLNQMREESVTFETGVEIGVDLSARYLHDKFDAIVVAAGSPKPRDIQIPGRQLHGIHFALEYLTQQTRLVLGDDISPDEMIDVYGKHVVVIGGGDTGSDCVGSVIRRGCASVTQIELLPEPPTVRLEDNPWPQWPRILRTSSSHKEGCFRMWSVGTKEFIGTEGSVEQVSCIQLEWNERNFKEIPKTEFALEADVVLLSMGFVADEHSPLIHSFDLSVDERGNIAIDETYASSIDKVFATGDAVTGASLVVRAINSGRLCAQSVHAYLSRG